MAGLLPPVTADVMLPELGIDMKDLKKYFTKMRRDFYRRVVAMMYNELLATAIEVTEGAKDDASSYFDNPTTGNAIGPQAQGGYHTGLLAGGLFHWARPKVTKRGVMVMGFGWTRRYGRVLEFGPSITQWMIFPKFKKALRWTTTNFHGPTRSGVAGRQTVFSDSARHKWDRSQLRPHLVPAVKKGRKKLERRILKGIGREFKRLAV